MPNPFLSAIRAAFDPTTAADPLQASRGDYAEATARRLGIPLAARPQTDPDDVIRVRPNRADRRREAQRLDVLGSYSRQLARKDSNA